MEKTARARYTLEFKQEAVRLVEAGQSIAAAARTLGVVDQTLYNWVKAQRQGKLEGADSKVEVSAEQMVIIRWASAVQRRHLSDVALLVHIKAIHAETRGGYGWPRT